MTPIQNLKIAMITDWHLALQEQVGVSFDKELAESTRAKALEMMQELADQLEPLMPEVEMSKTDMKSFTPPKVQFKKDGNPSKIAEKFFGELELKEDKWYSKDWDVFLPCHDILRTKRPFRMKDQGFLKDWLVDKGWRPTYWNYKKDSNNKFIRENGKLVKTSPKLQDKGNLCPNLELMLESGKAPREVTLAIQWLSLRNRVATIKSTDEDKDTGYLNHKRVINEGVLPAGNAGVTNTHRQKHRGVVNVPRLGSTLGKEFRSFFRAREGLKAVGYDASGLEARVEAHWCYKYTGGQAYAHELLEGDIHSTNARAFFGDDLPEEDGKVIGQYRNPAKNGKYALTYGSQVPTLATTLGITNEEAQVAFDNFWDSATPLREFKEKLIAHWTAQGKKGVFCPLSGAFLHSRSEHSLVNLVFQHTGAFIMDVSGMLMDRYLGGIHYAENGEHYYLLDGKPVRRLIYYHDEYMYEAHPDVADKVLELGIKSIVEAGKALKLHVPLEADGSIGDTWADVH